MQSKQTGVSLDGFKKILSSYSNDRFSQSQRETDAEDVISYIDQLNINEVIKQLSLFEYLSLKILMDEVQERSLESEKLNEMMTELDSKFINTKSSKKDKKLKRVLDNLVTTFTDLLIAKQASKVDSELQSYIQEEFENLIKGLSDSDLKNAEKDISFIKDKIDKRITDTASFSFYKALDALFRFVGFRTSLSGRISSLFSKPISLIKKGKGVKEKKAETKKKSYLPEDLTRAQEKLDEVEEKLVKEKEKLSVIERKTKELKEKIDKRKKKLARKKVKNLENEVRTKIKGVLKSFISEGKELNKEIRSLKTSMQKLEEKKKEALRKEFDLRIHLEKDISGTGSKRSIEMSLEKIEKFKKEADVELKNMQHKLKEIEKRYSKLDQQSIKSVEKMEAKLEKAMEKALKEVGKDSKVSELQKQLDKLNENLESSKLEVERLEVEYDKYEEEVDTIEDALEEDDEYDPDEDDLPPPIGLPPPPKFGAPSTKKGVTKTWGSQQKQEQEQEETPKVQMSSDVLKQLRKKMEEMRKKSEQKESTKNKTLESEGTKTPVDDTKEMKQAKGLISELDGISKESSKIMSSVKKMQNSTNSSVKKMRSLLVKMDESLGIPQQKGKQGLLSEIRQAGGVSYLHKVGDLPNKQKNKKVDPLKEELEKRLSSKNKGLSEPKEKEEKDLGKFLGNEMAKRRERMGYNDDNDDNDEGEDFDFDDYDNEDTKSKGWGINR